MKTMDFDLSEEQSKQVLQLMARKAGFGGIVMIDGILYAQKSSLLDNYPAFTMVIYEIDASLTFLKSKHNYFPAFMQAKSWKSAVEKIFETLDSGKNIGIGTVRCDIRQTIEWLAKPGQTIEEFLIDMEL